MNIRNKLSELSKCQTIIVGNQYDLKHVSDILHAIDKRQELWRYYDVSSQTIRDWLQTVFKKVTVCAFIHRTDALYMYCLLCTVAFMRFALCRMRRIVTYIHTYITFISPRIYKSSCIANFSEKEKEGKK